MNHLIEAREFSEARNAVGKLPSDFQTILNNMGKNSMLQLVFDNTQPPADIVAQVVSCSPEVREAIEALIDIP